MRIAPLIVAGLLCASCAPAQGGLREKLDAIYARGGYQRALPERHAIAADPHRPSSGVIAPPERRVRTDWDLRLPEWIGQALRWAVVALPWMALGALFLLAAIAIARARRARPGEGGTAAPPGRRPQGPGAEAVAVLPDPEALFREGRYAEAIHAILLAAIERLRALAPQGIAASLTSREVIRSARLAPDGQAALERIVRSVEITLFGERAAEPDDYLACAAALVVLGGRP